MKELIIASQNENKIEEIRSKLNHINVSGLDPLVFTSELLEDSNTLEGNAKQKAWQVFNRLQTDCFADDTGLEIEALSGEPGVYSARYAGAGKDSNANMDLVLEKMRGEVNRKARFRTVIALIYGGEEKIFEGFCNGTIAVKRIGEQGFGYDPIFIPDGFDKSFAQMNMDEKNKISHRARAVEKLVAFLMA